MKTLILITLIGSSAVALPKFLNNGKEIAPNVAVMAAMDSKNTVLQCEQVVAMADAKGTIKLRKKDANGNWVPVGK